MVCYPCDSEKSKIKNKTLQLMLARRTRGTRHVEIAANCCGVVTEAALSVWETPPRERPASAQRGRTSCGAKGGFAFSKFNFRPGQPAPTRMKKHCHGGRIAANRVAEFSVRNRHAGRASCRKGNVQACKKQEACSAVALWTRFRVLKTHSVGTSL